MSSEFFSKHSKLMFPLFTLYFFPIVIYQGHRKEWQKQGNSSKSKSNSGSNNTVDISKFNELGIYNNLQDKFDIHLYKSSQRTIEEK